MNQRKKEGESARTKEKEREGVRAGQGEQKSERRKRDERKREKEIGRNGENSRGKARARRMCYMTGRIEATLRWQRIEKRPEKREGK